jgi:hypothetical protein
MDLSHSGWSDIFFLGMDFPEGARVLNISIDLSRARLRRAPPSRPWKRGFRVIDEPVLRLTSVDLQSQRRTQLDCGGLRFRARLPGIAQGRGNRLRHRAPGNGGRHQPLADVLAHLTGGPATASKSSAR